MCLRGFGIWSRGKEGERWNETYDGGLIPLADAMGNAHDRPGHALAEAAVLGAHSAMVGGALGLLLDGIVGVSSDPGGKRLWSAINSQFSDPRD